MKFYGGGRGGMGWVVKGMWLDIGGYWDQELALVEVCALQVLGICSQSMDIWWQSKEHH